MNAPRENDELSPEQNAELADAEKVDKAMELLYKRDFQNAFQLLSEVSENAPTDYVYQYEKDDVLYIKFWDQEEFVYYVMRREETDNAKEIVWLPSAYPRAFYYLGFIKVHQDEPDAAMRYLEAGQRLEPTNAHFELEMAQVAAIKQETEKIIGYYEQVLERGLDVPPACRAVAMRGKAVRLIDQDKLDEAEELFHESLIIDPDSEVAKGELAYIASLRSGATAKRTSRVQSAVQGAQKCVRCDKEFETGQVFEIEGNIIYVCERCHNKMSRPWWQFWK